MFETYCQGLLLWENLFTLNFSLSKATNEFKVSCLDITKADNDFCEAISHVLGSSLELREIKLDFWCCNKITNKGVIKVIDGLKKQRSLKTLWLNLSKS